MLALAARKGWAMDNFDFDQAYLNSKLGDNEVVYVEQPPDYETKDRWYWVMLLLKALYGLKQGARWITRAAHCNHTVQNGRFCSMVTVPMLSWF